MTALIRSIDHVVVAVPSVEDAVVPWVRLGVTVTPRMEHQGAGTANRVFMVGGEEDAFYVEFLEVHDESQATAPALDAYKAAAAAGGGLARVIFESDALAQVAKRLADAGVETHAREVHRDDGSKIADVLVPAGPTQAGVDFGVIEYVLPGAERYAARKGRGLFEHEVAFKRLDHLAAIAPDTGASLAFFDAVLGVERTGMVESPVMRIHQLSIGGAILELLEAATPESPLAARPPGIVSMVAIELGDLDAAVAHARSRGLTAPDAATGVLPGTRTSPIPPAELGGLGLQLLEYVRD